MHIKKLFDLEGKVALVTGGAGLFGRQIVQALAEAGATTIMASRNVDSLRMQAEQFASEGLKVNVTSFDQGSESSILELKERLTGEHGQIDVLVNNSVLRPMKSWNDHASAFEESMHVNATGIFLMTRTFGNAMAERSSGSIINVGSIQGCIGPDLPMYAGVTNPPPPDYFIHKGGMIQLTRYAASILGVNNVRVNCISPGGFLFDQPHAFVKRYCERTFLGRMANEQDLKGTIVFLASEASAYITGTNILIDGGYTAK
jgi:NAD(P)-dependent dehydrogenase (short-subunit alcohol dehydrogenase family)